MRDFLGRCRFVFLSLEGCLDARGWRLGIAALVLLSLLIQRVLPLLVDHDGLAGRFVIFTFFIASLYPFTALCAKRFHDRGRSGDFAFAVSGPCAVHAALNANGLLGLASPVGVALGLMILGGCIWFLLELGFGASAPSAKPQRTRAQISS